MGYYFSLCGGSVVLFVPVCEVVVVFCLGFVLLRVLGFDGGGVFLWDCAGLFFVVRSWRACLSLL
jgi:hypothetical protein